MKQKKKKKDDDITAQIMTSSYKSTIIALNIEAPSQQPNGVNK